MLLEQEKPQLEQPPAESIIQEHPLEQSEQLSQSKESFQFNDCGSQKEPESIHQQSQSYADLTYAQFGELVRKNIQNRLPNLDDVEEDSAIFKSHGHTHEETTQPTTNQMQIYS